MVLQEVLNIVLILLAFPVGYWIAYMARDELIVGRRWFRTLMILSAFVGIWFYLSGILYISLSCLFIFVISLIAYYKSFDKRWTKRN
jgi:hypothetical protein